jgi:hypothetical protein
VMNQRLGDARKAGIAGLMCLVSALAVHAVPANAAAPTFDVGLNGSQETSWTYTDTAEWDEFNDITASIGGGTVANTGWTAVASPIVAPNTDVLQYGYYKDGTYGRMFLGENTWYSTPHFTYVVNSNAINALTNGTTASDAFTFTIGSDTSTFTVNVSGVSDAPLVTKTIADITDGLAQTAGGTSARLPSGSSAFGFSGSSSYYTPSGEKVEKAFDGLASTKYLNFGKMGSDVLIDAGQAFIVSGVTLVTANDESSRDPLSLEVYGSSSAFTSATDMSSWMAGATQLGSRVTLSPPSARQTTYPKAEVSNPNRLDFRYLRLLFPTIRNSGANSMQVSEIRIEGNKKSSEASFAQGAGAVIIMGDTTIIGENPTGATLTLTGTVTGDVLSCTACPVNGYNAAWNGTSNTLTITKASAPYSSTDLTTALQSVKFDNPSHTGARTAPGANLTVTDLNGTSSTALVYSVGMGATRTLTLGVSGGSTPSSITYGSTVTLQATASAGTGAITYEIVSGDCTLSSAVLTMGKQTCKVRSLIEFDGTNSKTISETLTFAMAPKSITIAASSHNVTAGDAVPTIRPVVTGLVGTDTVAVISGLTCSTTYTTTSAAGTYVSRCTGTPTATGYSVSGSVANGVVTAAAAATTTTAAPISPVTTAASSSGASSATTAPIGQGQLPVIGARPRSTTTTTSSSSSASTTTTAVTAPLVVASTTTVPSLEVPEVSNGAAGLLFEGETLSVDIQRVNDELVMTAGPIAARIWAVSADNEKLSLDSNGHLRLLQGDSIRTEVEGFDANSDVNVRFYPSSITLGSGTVSASGKLTESYTVPAETPNGYTQVVLEGTADDEPIIFTLSLAIGDTSGSFNALVVVPLLALAVIGGLLIPIAWRRRRDDEKAS